MRKFTYPSGIAGLLTGLLMAACASNVPPQIRQAPADSPALDEVLGDAAGYVSRQVRWGGVILETDNRANTTRVIMLALPLSNSGKPNISDASPGRFIAVVPVFLDPTVYSKDRRLTVLDEQLGEYGLRQRMQAARPARSANFPTATRSSMSSTTTCGRSNPNCRPATGIPGGTIPGGTIPGMTPGTRIGIPIVADFTRR